MPIPERTVSKVVSARRYPGVRRLAMFWLIVSIAVACAIIAATLGPQWTVVTTDTRAREMSTDDGAPATIRDAVLVARRALSV